MRHGHEPCGSKRVELCIAPRACRPAQSRWVAGRQRSDDGMMDGECRCTDEATIAEFAPIVCMCNLTAAPEFPVSFIDLSRAPPYATNCKVVCQGSPLVLQWAGETTTSQAFSVAAGV